METEKAGRPNMNRSESASASLRPLTKRARRNVATEEEVVVSRPEESTASVWDGIQISSKEPWSHPVIVREETPTASQGSNSVVAGDILKSIRSSVVSSEATTGSPVVVVTDSNQTSEGMSVMPIGPGSVGALSSGSTIDAAVLFGDSTMNRRRSVVPVPDSDEMSPVSGVDSLFTACPDGDVNLRAESSVDTSCEQTTVREGRFRRRGPPSLESKLQDRRPDGAK